LAGIRFSRFLRHPRVSVPALAVHAAAATAERVAGRRVLAIQDTSDLILGGPRARASGYGPVGKGGNLGGLCLHPVLAVDADTGALLGLVDLAIWNREGGQRVTARTKRAVAEKESQRWLTGAARTAERLSRAARVMVVADRESDIYAAFAARPASIDLLIRAAQDRRIVHGPDEPDSVFALADALPEQGCLSLALPSIPGRSARTARLALRFAPLTLRRPRNAPRNEAEPTSVGLFLVDARECVPPDDGAVPVHWTLLTSRPIETLEQAVDLLDAYSRRWIIEQLFRTLKTAGFDIEATDIATPAVMERFAAAATVASVTIMQMVQARDGHTDEPLEQAFAAEDRPLLEAVCTTLEGKTARQKNPHRRGSLAYATWVIARLGGWTGYYGKQGPQVLRRGLDSFRAIKLGAALRPPDV
jgi:hypothetical protein